MKKSVLLKLSGEALKGNSKHIIDHNVVLKIARQVLKLKKANYNVAIVVGAGNIWRGESGSALGMQRVQADNMGMLATIMNGIAVEDALESIGLETRLMSAMEINKIAEPYIRKKALSHFSKNRILILAGGTGSPFFSTDSAAALRAIELNIPLILMAKNGVDGIYSDDPKKNKKATKYKEITYQEILEKHLNVIDQTAASLCNDNKVKMIVFDMNDEKNIDRFLKNEKIGTLVKP